LLIALTACATNSYAQIKVTKITANSKDIYIENVIGYPITGTYMYVNQLEPITLLNEDGTGTIQNEDLSKVNITWGIECSESGIPIFKEGFNSASYSFWYKNNEETDWVQTSFTIHYDKKKIFISGERVKEYIE
jgi:hypothetical protein